MRPGPGPISSTWSPSSPAASTQGMSSSSSIWAHWGLARNWRWVSFTPLLVRFLVMAVSAQSVKDLPMSAKSGLVDMRTGGRPPAGSFPYEGAGTRRHDEVALPRPAPDRVRLSRGGRGRNRRLPLPLTPAAGGLDTGGRGASHDDSEFGADDLRLFHPRDGSGPRRPGADPAGSAGPQGDDDLFRSLAHRPTVLRRHGRRLSSTRWADSSPNCSIKSSP